MEDFYFAYDYDIDHNYASKICRHYQHHFEQYNKENGQWEVNNELSRIFIGEDIYFDEITEDQAMKLIKSN